ncbi:MAG: 4-carboxymuconolactone decarboxylase [Kiloniellales bacterium]
MTNDRIEAGLEVRREVLGAAHVDRAMDNANDFTRPFQELLNEYCWGRVWTRPGLDRRSRSLLNLAMLTALNRPNEFRLHMRGAIRNGCTSDEIREVLLQTAIYCGMPAAVQSFAIAREVLDEAAGG